MKNQSIEKIQSEILDELDELDDWRERYDFIIDAGREMPSLPESCRIEENLINGCVSQLWVTSDFRDGRMVFQADSDSLFVKGLAAILIRIYSGQKPNEILSSERNFLVESGIVAHLSPNRANGAANLFRRILRDSQANCG